MAALPMDYEDYQRRTDILFQVHDYIDGTYTIFPEPPWKKEAVQNQQLSIFSLFDQPGREEQEDIIQSIPLPSLIKTELIRSNRSEVYDSLGVNTFFDYDYIPNHH